MKYIWFVLMVFISACAKEEIYSCKDRTKCPEGALHEAKKALKNKDMTMFFETITDNEVRLKLRNSIGMCSSLKRKESKKYGYNESIGCDEILEKYGWEEPKYNHPSEINNHWDDAVKNIQYPRKMLFELETNHREYARASSFVWSYLEPVKILSTTTQGNTAYSNIEWHGENRKLLYYKSQQGWQFEVEPWEAH